MKNLSLLSGLALSVLLLAPACGGSDDDDAVNPSEAKLVEYLQEGRSVTIRDTWRSVENASVTIQNGATLTLEGGASLDIQNGNLVVNSGGTLVVRGEDSEVEVTGDVTANTGAVIQLEDDGDLDVNGSLTLNGGQVTANGGDLDVSGNLTLNAGSSITSNDGLRIDGDLKLNAPDTYVRSLDELVVRGTLTINSGTVHNGTDDANVPRPEAHEAGDTDAMIYKLELNGSEAKFINYGRWYANIHGGLLVNSGTVENQNAEARSMTARSCTLNGGTVSEGICPAE